jgi:polysaccharide export outer membrane protein
MLLSKKITSSLLAIFCLSLFVGCVASPKPEATSLLKIKQIKQTKVANKKIKNQNKLEVIEKDFEIIHTGLDHKKISKELLSLHTKEDSNYVIGAGDMFNVFVYEEPELNVKGSIVKADGTLTFQLIGDVKVAALTINEAMAKIAKKLKRYLINPIVSIIPVEFRSKSFTILGKVSEPGTYQITNDAKAIDSIAIAQGLSIGIFEDNTIELADLEHAFIRRGNKVLPVNFIELVRKGNPLHNIPLKDKDYIYIPSALNTEVYILGEVNLPGHYGFKENMTLSQVVTYAKGFKVNANLQQVAIIRGTLTNPIVYLANLEDILEGKSKDFRVKPFDIVYIPTSTLGDWNNILQTILPSLETIQSAYITNQLLKGN